jgi:hypothetical protein
MTRFVQVLLISEYLLVEIPVNTVTMVSINNPTNEGLFAVVKVLVGVGAVLLAVVFMIMPGLYLYLAWSKFSSRGT